jgi:hypothetical protein
LIFSWEDLETSLQRGSIGFFSGNAGDSGSFEEESEVHLRIYRVADPVTHELVPCSEWTYDGVIRNRGRLAENLSGANRVAVADPEVAGAYACIGALFPRANNIVMTTGTTSSTEMGMSTSRHRTTTLSES